MARTESRAYDSFFDPVWTGAGAPKIPGGAVAFDASAMSGSGRYKFFQRPMVAQRDPMPASVLLAPAREDPLAAPEAPEARAKDRGVQTTYRESEAQTDPYSPEYVVKEGEDPQVLMLKGLTHGRGLPATEKEVAMIEHAQQKRHLERSLPPATDEASLALRRRLLELQELREFDLRQKEVDGAHAERLELLRRALGDRDQDAEFLAEQRVEALRQKRAEERDRALEGIQAQRIKVLRKLSMARGRLRLPASDPPGPKSRRASTRDIIAEYGNYASRVYAPIARSGQRTDKDSNQYDVTSVVPELAHNGVLAAIEAHMPPRLTETKIEVPALEGSGVARTAAERHTQQLAADLVQMTAMLEAAKDPTKKAATNELALPAWRTQRSTAERPPTPRIAARDPEEDKFEQAVKFFQRLLRGRAVQNEMFKGKEKRIELIRELRAADEAAREEADSGANAGLAEEVRRARARAAVARGAVDAVAGEVASATLDFLSKELVRQEEKDRLLGLAKKADAERRQREAEEAGRRQAEERLRARNDEVYKQVVAANLGAARTFVDEIMSGAVEDAASGQAIAGLQADAGLGEAMKRAATPKAPGADEATSAAFVQDLVASFLTPSVENLQVREEDREDEKHLADAAQKSVVEAVTEITRNPL